MAAIEERFHAAVNVIKGLPKNGPYQPSTGMMLKFYGLFKQATEGVCEQKKPSLFNLVGKAKWDAWMSNQHLSKEQAMQRYVESLQEIIETMSFTENVQNFVGSLDGLSNINLDELELVSPGMKELAESHPNSPFHSRTNSPQHGSSCNGQEEAVATEDSAIATSTSSTDGLSLPKENGHITPSSVLTNGYSNVNNKSTGYHDQSYNNSSVAIVDPSDDEYDDPYDLSHELTQAISRNTDLLRQIQATITRMNTDVGAVQQRVCSLEQSLLELKNAQKNARGRGSSQQQPAWWPFKQISPLWFVVLVLWPFLVRRFARMLQTSTQHKR